MEAADSPSSGPDLDWELWYVDTFDRECPPSCELRGRGLARGLLELWARHLFETVQPDGGRGFSAFYLKAPAGRIEVDGPWEGGVRLREWIFGNSDSAAGGYLAEADAGLLVNVAAAHALLCAGGRSSAPILEAALASENEQDFEGRLRRSMKT